MPSLPQLGGVASACKRCLRRLGWRQGRLPPGGSPAHDLVGEQNAAHLRVLVLAFINDGLRGGQAEAGVTKSLRLGRQTTTGTAGLAGGRCTAPRGETTSTTGHPPTPPPQARGQASEASHRPLAELFPRAHAGPGLRRAAGRARQGLPRPGRSLQGRADSHPAPGAWATAAWRDPLAIVYTKSG